MRNSSAAAGISRMMRPTGALLLVLLFADARPSHSTTEGPVVIHQPIFTHDSGIDTGPVTYASRGDIQASPGCMVGLTLSENRIGVGGGFAFENRNAANMAGLRLRLVEHSEPAPNGAHLPPGLFGDTLRVVLDVSAAREDSGDLADLLPSTRDCLLLNAEIERRTFRFLDLRIEGVDGFAELEGVYLVSERRKLTD